MRSQNGVLAIVYTKDPLRFLILHNKKTGNVTFPAGTQEEKENILETLRREVEEEAGLKFNEYVIRKTNLVYKFSNEKKKGVQRVYLLETKKLNTKSIDKNLEIKGWFDYDESMKILTFNGHKKILEKAKECYFKIFFESTKDLKRGVT